MSFKLSSKRIGIALGGGSARGWSHIGVLNALHELGIEPSVVTGTSMGAAVGAAYASDNLAPLEKWALGLDWWNIIRLMELRSMGMIAGDRLMKAFAHRAPDMPIEDMGKSFGAVATDLGSGREVWFTKGSSITAIRASVALPGLFSPVKHEGRWLVDGGLVDPVPVSLCRVLGAELVIAVNLNGDVSGRNVVRGSRRSSASEFFDRIKPRWPGMLSKDGKPEEITDENESPGLFDVITGSMNIMSDRITRSRMAGDPPDVMLSPRVSHIALMDFDRAREAIDAGLNCVESYRPVLEDVLGV